MIDKCELMTSGACGIPLPVDPNIVLGIVPYSITAKDDVSLGYTLSLCYSCDIKPTGLPIITFPYDLVTITQDPLNCSPSLAVVGPAFVNPPNIPYTTAGSAVTIVADYTSIWAHT